MWSHIHGKSVNRRDIVCGGYVDDESVNYKLIWKYHLKNGCRMGTIIGIVEVLLIETTFNDKITQVYIKVAILLGLISKIIYLVSTFQRAKANSCM